MYRDGNVVFNEEFVGILRIKKFLLPLRGAGGKLTEIYFTIRVQQ